MKVLNFQGSVVRRKRWLSSSTIAAYFKQTSEIVAGEKTLPWEAHAHSLGATIAWTIGQRVLRTTVLSGEKFQDRVVCCTWLVGLENVAGMGDQYEFGPWNTFGD